MINLTAGAGLWASPCETSARFQSHGFPTQQLHKHHSILSQSAKSVYPIEINAKVKLAFPAGSW